MRIHSALIMYDASLRLSDNIVVGHCLRLGHINYRLQNFLRQERQVLLKLDRLFLVFDELIPLICELFGCKYESPLFLLGFENKRKLNSLRFWVFFYSQVLDVSLLIFGWWYGLEIRVNVVDIVKRMAIVIEN